ncbi:MAG: Ribonuclease G [Chlamydiia bacterium]|nr:Ribonuclease G [Chlamydiia bacterium]
MKELLLSIEPNETRLAKLNNRKLDEVLIERKKSRQLSGNIYRGKVTNILKNIQSAFIDIGEGENGFIHISDILENTQKFQEMFDMDFDWGFDVSKYSANTQKEKDINKLLKQDEAVLVQVVKEPIGTKGARLTSNISIPGRYLVLLPNSQHRGVSRKISDPVSRERLKHIISAFEMPTDMGLICRTASVHATTDQLIEEAHELLETWNKIMQGFNDSKGSACLYRESNIVKKALVTALDKKYDRLLIDHYQTYLDCCRLHSRYEKDKKLKLEFYRDKVPMFERFNVEREIERSLKRKIWMQSGGYLYFEKTEAMHTVDVNSGRSSQNDPKQDVEETLVQINMEAAEEIARQLRIRNVGGLIICDFIDMRSRKNQRRVLDRLKEAMKEDSAKCTILSMSEFGLVEMTRQRTRESLMQILCDTCPYCDGSGMVKNYESVSVEIERAIRRAFVAEGERAIEVRMHPEVDAYIAKTDKGLIQKMAEKLECKVSFATDDNFHTSQFEIAAIP